jgi:hypothetical protein
MGIFQSTPEIHYDELQFDETELSNELSHTIIANRNTKVFMIDRLPNFVFKQSNCFNAIEHRFKCIKIAQKICDDNNLDKLVIPRAKIIILDGSTTLVEEYYDFNPTESFQKELYFSSGEELDEAIRQLTIFIAKSGFYDVTWRNIPIYNNKIILIDLEHLNNINKTAGFTGGGNGSCGLLGCVSIRHFDLVISELKKIKISFDVTQIKKYNEFEQLELQNVKKFYSEHNIISGYELLKLRHESISYLSVDSKFREKLIQLTCDTVKEINEQIKKSDSNDIPAGKRYLLLNTNDFEKCYYKMDTTIPSDEQNIHNNYKSDKDYYDATYLGMVVQKLIEVGLIYKVVKRNGHGYFIQV